MCRFVLFLLVYLCSTAGFTQDGGEWTHYPVTDELNLKEVSALTADKNGILWVGTESGLYRFDGTTWVFYTSEQIGGDDIISSMVCDDNGTLHVTALNYSTLSDNIWTNHLNEIRIFRDFFPPEYVDVALDGEVWLGGYKSVVNYDGTSWVSHIIDNGSYTIGSLAVDSSGDVWCGTRERSILKFDGEAWTKYTEKDGLGDISRVCIYVSPDGTVWCGGYRWIARFDGFTSWQVIDGNPLHFSDEHLTVDSLGKVWIFESPFFASYDGKNWKRYLLPDSKSGITSFTVDRNGIVWIGTTENGIYRFEPNPTAVDDNFSNAIDKLIIKSYPNPFNPATTLSYNLAGDSRVTLAVYNISGQKVATLVDEAMPAGTHRAVFDGAGLASGMYFYRIEAGNVMRSGKMLLMK